MTFGLVLIGLAIVLFAVAMIGAIMDGRGRGFVAAAVKTPFELIMAALKKPIASLTEAGVDWFKRVAALAEIVFIAGLVLALGSVLFGAGDDGSDTPATTVDATTTTLG